MASKFISNDMSLMTYEKTIGDIHTNYAFQRPKGCWSRTQKQGFIQSVFDGFNSNPIVVANILQCLDHSRILKDLKSIAYYSALFDSGDRYVSLDGQHRTIAIDEFLKDKWGFTGTIELENGESLTIVNQKWSDMSIDAQNTFYMKNVLFQQFHFATRSQLAPIFVAINSGSPLTPQHMRNALDSPLPAVVRDLVSRYKKTVKAYYNPEQSAKMKSHEDVSKMLMHFTDQNLEVFKKGLDAFYAKGIEHGVEGEFSKAYSTSARTTLESVLGYLEQISYIIGKPKGLTDGKHKPSLLLMVLTLHAAVKNGYEITSVKKFATAVGKIDVKLEKDSVQKRGLDESNNTPAADMDYYSHWKNQNWHVKCRNNRQRDLWTEMESNLSTFGLSKIMVQQAAK